MIPDCHSEATLEQRFKRKLSPFSKPDFPGKIYCIYTKIFVLLIGCMNESEQDTRISPDEQEKCANLKQNA